MMMMMMMMMMVIIAGFIPRYTHCHTVYSSQREEYLFLLKAYCCCCSLEDGSTAAISPSLPMHLRREPHSINPQHLAARSDATVTQRTHLISSQSGVGEEEELVVGLYKTDAIASRWVPLLLIDPLGEHVRIDFLERENRQPPLLCSAVGQEPYALSCDVLLVEKG
jgi:hypothetical protein